MKALIVGLVLSLTACGEDVARFQNTSTATTIAGVSGKFDQVQTSQAELLSRKDGASNQMETDLDMNNYRIYNLPKPQSNGEPARVQDILNAIEGDIIYQEVIQDGVVNVQQQFDAGDSKGNTPADNLLKINLAIDYALAEGYTKLYFPTDTYTLSNTMVIPSGFEVYGDTGRLGSHIVQGLVNNPVIANEAWKLNSSPLGSIHIHDLWISGANVRGSRNHGIVLTDFYSTVDNVYISDTGGYGMYFASETENGTFNATTLVENNFTNSTLRNCNNGFRNGSTSDVETPKLTDGHISNIRIDMNSNFTGEVFELYEAAGWHVAGLHTYAHGTSLKFDKLSATNLSDFYIENRGTDGYVFKVSKMGRHVNAKGIIVSDLLEDGDKIFRIFPAGGIDKANINISDISVVAGNNAEVIIASKEATGIEVNLWNWNVSYGISVVTPVTPRGVKPAFSMATNGSYLDNDAEFRLKNSLVEDDDDLQRLRYGNSRIAQTVSKKTTYFDGTHVGTKTHRVVFSVPALAQGDFLSGTLTINLSQNNSSTQQAYWSGDLLVGSSSGSSSTWYSTLNLKGIPVNVPLPPTVTVDGVSKTITVEVVHTGASDLGTGLITYDFVNGE